MHTFGIACCSARLRNLRRSYTEAQEDLEQPSVRPRARLRAAARVDIRQAAVQLGNRRAAAEDNQAAVVVRAADSPAGMHSRWASWVSVPDRLFCRMR